MIQKSLEAGLASIWRTKEGLLVDVAFFKSGVFSNLFLGGR